MKEPARGTEALMSSPTVNPEAGTTGTRSPLRAGELPGESWWGNGMARTLMFLQFPDKTIISVSVMKYSHKGLW